MPILGNRGKTVANYTLLVQKQCALEHFYSHHSRNEEERFVVLWQSLVSLVLKQFTGFCHSKHLSTQKVSSLKSRK